MSAGFELLSQHHNIVFCYAPKMKRMYHDYYEMIMFLNEVLEDKYKITEYRGFRKVYDTYMEWLIQKYLDDSFSFNRHYKRKVENKKALEDVCGGKAQHMYFLAQTLYDHLKEYQETYSYCFKDEYHYTIVYKMYLAVQKIIHIAENKIGNKQTYDIEQYEKITEGMINHTFKKYIEEYDYLNKKFEQNADDFS